MEQDQTNEFVVTATQVVKNVVDIYLNKAIETSDQFLNTVQVLDSLNEGDEVSLHVSCVGGCLYSTDMFLRSLSDAQERGVEVTAYCTGLVASAATLIVLSCDNVVVSPNSCFLFHCGGVAEGGTFAQFKVSSTFSIKWMEGIFKRYYSNVLSKEELAHMLEGCDYWFTGEEMLARLANAKPTDNQETQKEAN